MRNRDRTARGPDDGDPIERAWSCRDRAKAKASAPSETRNGHTQEKLPGHAECWRLVKLAREIRMIGTKETTEDVLPSP